METKTCPKCSSPMHPGFPVEVQSTKAARTVTYWSDQLPQEIAGIFGGQAFLARGIPSEVLMGFACGQCGFVELYKVSEQQLQQFLQAAAADYPPGTPFK